MHQGCTCAAGLEKTANEDRVELAGDTEGALADYRAAAARTTSLPEQRYLTTRAARLRRAQGVTGITLDR
jgi:hypothetical protein